MNRCPSGHSPASAARGSPGARGRCPNTESGREPSARRPARTTAGCSPGRPAGTRRSRHGRWTRSSPVRPAGTTRRARPMRRKSPRAAPRRPSTRRRSPRCLRPLEHGKRLHEQLRLAADDGRHGGSVGTLGIGGLRRDRGNRDRAQEAIGPRPGRSLTAGSASGRAPREPGRPGQIHGRSPRGKDQFRVRGALNRYDAHLALPSWTAPWRPRRWCTAGRRKRPSPDRRLPTGVSGVGG